MAVMAMAKAAQEVTVVPAIAGMITQEMTEETRVAATADELVASCAAAMEAGARVAVTAVVVMA